MLAFNHRLGQVQPFRKLKSKESSLKKDTNTKQNSSKVIHSYYTHKQHPNTAFVSQFQLYKAQPHQINPNPLKIPQKIEYQIDMNQLHLNIQKQIMHCFKLEYQQLQKSLSSISTNSQASSQQTTSLSSFRQSCQDQPTNESKFKRVSDNLILEDKSTLTNHEKALSGDISLPKMNQPSRQRVDQQRKTNKNDYKAQQGKTDDNIEDKRNEKRNGQKGYEVRQKSYCSGFDIFDNRQKSGIMMNSESLQLSAQSKQFKRSFDRVMLAGQPCLNQAELSLISSQGNQNGRGRSGVGILFQKICEGKVVVYNKLLFMQGQI